jgi:XTP/dITP diphosphohydrolase
MKKLVFASNNPNKLKEIQDVLANVEILSLKDIECFDELPETQDTLEGNAFQKAQYVKDHFGFDCFADDTGLMVEALDGRPGVYSARYAGPDCSSEENMDLLLKELSEKDNRKAKFSTVIALVTEKDQQSFEGSVEGVILEARSGSEGFGYDPIFKPESSDVSFAQMSKSDKNKISHRGRAVKKFSEYLIEMT